ncbi:Panacea domain-containing protein [uncultured Megasphaera sp.]|uniref:Panacea domain-containing protein n=1 Tax=uncultured Megasphaera sp. TaxID=165188 RepID=UPI002595FBE1|nr:type II toxin-antitoxin system antitoxin SocA domain-containing protein [uncultured Megasphaera sp.]
MSYTAKEVAKWFLNYNQYEQKVYGDTEYISDSKLQKLLYYAYGAYLAIYDQRLFDEPIQAGQHGPFVQSVYEAYKHFGLKGITEFEPLQEVFSEQAQSVLQWVYENFGQYTAWALRNMTHAEDPWQEAIANSAMSDAAIVAFFQRNYVEVV